MAKLAKSTLPISLDRATAANDEHSELRLEVERLREAALEWKAERAQLTADLERARTLLADSDEAAAIALERQIRTTVDRVRAELTDSADHLRSQIEHLTRTNREQAAERDQLLAQLEQARLSLAESDAAAAIALEVQVSTAAERVRAEYRSETDKLRKELEGQAQVSGNWVNERTQLADERDKARQDLAAVTQQHQAETDSLRHELQQRINQASTEWDRERVQLAAERDKARQDLAAAKQEHQLAVTELQKTALDTSQGDTAAALEDVRKETDKVRHELRQQLAQTSTQWDKERAQLAAERDKAHSDLAALKQQHQRALAEAQKQTPEAAENARDQLVAETEKLRLELKQLTQASVDEKEEYRRMLQDSQKAAELDKAEAVDRVRSELEAEADKLRQQMHQQLFQIVTETRKSMVADFCRDVVDGEGPPIPKKAPGPPDALLAEVARVEALILSISELIENEQTNLSVVIRKSAERAELESYLKGIRFSMSEKTIKWR